MALIFEWDEEKDLSNRHKHRVGFDEAKTVFNDTHSITIVDIHHSDDEDRFIDIGMSSQGRLIVVAYTERGDNIRIISCRKATKSERKVYAETK